MNDLDAIEPVILRTLVQASREHRRVDLSYISMTSGIEEDRIIVPHTLVYTPLRWHVRAYCEKHGDFRDFVLSRFRGSSELLNESQFTSEEDKIWNKEITLEIVPDSRLGEAQQEIVARDFNMKNRCLLIKIRAPLVAYMLQALNIDPHTQEIHPEAQQIVVGNFREIKPYLF